MKYYLLPIFLVVFICGNLFAQSEYKITTESTIWQGFSSSDAVITAFITITNTGSTDNWYENFSGFRLRSKNSGIYYKLVDTRKILENEINPGEFVSASISFLVPRYADSLLLVYPERYGGKETFLVRSYDISKKKKDFNEDSEPYVSEKEITRTIKQDPNYGNNGNTKPTNQDPYYGNNENSKTKEYEPSNEDDNRKPSKGVYTTNPANSIFLFPTFIGGGILTTNKGNRSKNFWQLGYKVPVKIKTFKKQNLNLFVDVELLLTKNIDFENKDDFLDFYGIDNNTYTAKNDSGSGKPIYSWSIYGGFAVEYYKSPIIAPWISTKIGYNFLNDSYVRIYKTANGPNNYISRAEDLSGLGFQFQFGLTFFKKICLYYNYYTFKATNGGSILNSTYTGHFLNLWLGGLVF